MMPPRSFPFWLVLSCLWMLPLHAQTTGPAIPSAPTTGWQQLESTYQNELKKIHLPLLSAYINELTRLAAASRSAETTVAINRELQEMQKIIASGGVVDLSPPNTKEAPPDPALKPALAKSKPERLLELRPATAQEITPTPPNPIPSIIPIQKITWTIDALPKGKFEVICQGAIHSLDAPVSLVIQIGDQLLKLPLEKRHIATDPESLRLIQVGVFQLENDETRLPLVVSLETTASPPPSFLLRQILIARSKPNLP